MCIFGCVLNKNQIKLIGSVVEMAYKIVKIRHYLGSKFIYRIVNTGVKGAHTFGVNRSFDTLKEAEEHMRKGLYSGNF